MNTLNRILLSVATLGLAAGCATTAATTATTAVKPRDLKGSWSSATCEVMANADGSKTYFKRHFDLTEADWKLRFEAYGDEGCSAKLFTARFEGPYELGKDSQAVPGATEGNFRFARHYMTAHAQPIAGWFQGAKCASGTWELDKEQETGTTGCAFLKPVSACQLDHDLVKVEGDKLYFGQRPADNDMCTPDKRPTSLGTPVVRR